MKLIVQKAVVQLYPFTHFSVSYESVGVHILCMLCAWESKTIDREVWHAHAVQFLYFYKRDKRQWSFCYLEHSMTFWCLRINIAISSELLTLSTSFFQHILPHHLNIIWCLAQAGYWRYEVRYHTGYKAAIYSGRRVWIALNRCIRREVLSLFTSSDC